MKQLLNLLLLVDFWSMHKFYSFVLMGVVIIIIPCMVLSIIFLAHNNLVCVMMAVR